MGWQTFGEVVQRLDGLRVLGQRLAKEGFQLQAPGLQQSGLWRDFSTTPAQKLADMMGKSPSAGRPSASFAGLTF